MSEEDDWLTTQPPAAKPAPTKADFVPLPPPPRKGKHLTVYVPVTLDIPVANRRLLDLGGRTVNQYLTQCLSQIIKAAEQGALPNTISLE